MTTTAEAFARALEYHQAGNLSQAEELYCHLLQAEPNHAGSHHLLGVLAYQKGNYQQAVAQIREAITLRPEAAVYHSNLGLAYQALNQLDEAQTQYYEALRLEPAFAEAHGNLGDALRRQGRLSEAVAHCREAVRLRPTLAEGHCGLAVALAEQGNLEEAIAHYSQALELKPDFAEAHSNFAHALLGQGKLDEAVAHCLEALRLRSDLAAAHSNLGNARLQEQRWDEAVSSFREALRIDASLVEAHCGLATSLLAQGLLDEAVRHFQLALDLKPNCTAAHDGLGCAQLRQGQPQCAAASFRQALEFQPDLASAQSNLLSSLNYDPDIDPEVVCEEHRRWGSKQLLVASGQLSEQANPSDNWRLTTDNYVDPERRLRIGYVSPDLRDHALMRYLEPVFAHHDPRQVHISCYAEVPVPDAVTERFQKLAHAWRWTVRQSDAQMAQQIRDDGIDILVDLAGHTGSNRLRVFALKPAPIQVSWLGYMNTTGLAAVDYRLTDDILDPTSGVRCPASGVKSTSPDIGLRTPDSGRFSTEELVRLPCGMCCFAPPADAPRVAPLPALTKSRLTFGSLNGLLKLNAKVLDLWSRILHALPTAQLLMFHSTLVGTARDRIRRHFVGSGIAPERLDLRQGWSSGAYLGIYGEIDVSLDPFPFSGGVTTCESLWMGVPVLSLCGKSPAGRNSAAILARVGLSDWAVPTPDEYVGLAKRLDNDLEGLGSLRAQLRERMKLSLCDAPRFTRQLEEAYRTMWRRRCARDASHEYEAAKRNSGEGLTTS
jgi:protein O-GlcNAc transferase